MRRPNFTLSVKAKKRLLQIFIGLAIGYFSISGYIWWAMNQPPERFAKRCAGPRRLQEQAWPIWISSG